jgi:hypothetical protein
VPERKWIRISAEHLTEEEGLILARTYDRLVQVTNLKRLDVNHCAQFALTVFNNISSGCKLWRIGGYNVEA